MKVWMIETLHGTDIVAGVDESKSTDSELCLVNPLRYIVRPHPTTPGALQETFADLSRYAKSPEEIMMPKTCRFLVYEPEERIAKNYTEAVKGMKMHRSGLVAPTARETRGLSL